MPSETVSKINLVDLAGRLEISVLLIKIFSKYDHGQDVYCMKSLEYY
jgi:hypothetical protein